MNIAGTTKLEKQAITSIRMTIDGLRGSGKTTLLGTLTPPVLLFNFDAGFKGVLDSQEGKEIYIADLSEEFDYAFKIDKNTKENALDLKNKYESIMEDAINQGVRSIGVDGGWILWEIYKLSCFGDEEPLPAAYGKVNAEFEHMVRQFEYRDVNFVMTHHLKEKWTGAKTKVKDEYVVAGYSRIENLVQACLTVSEEMEYDENGNEKAVYWTGKFRKSRFNPALLVMPSISSKDGMLNFPFIASLITGTDPKHWR